MRFKILPSSSLKAPLLSSLQVRLALLHFCLFLQNDPTKIDYYLPAPLLQQPFNKWHHDAHHFLYNDSHGQMEELCCNYAIWVWMNPPDGLTRVCESFLGNVPSPNQHCGMLHQHGIQHYRGYDYQSSTWQGNHQYRGDYNQGLKTAFFLMQKSKSTQCQCAEVWNMLMSHFIPWSIRWTPTVPNSIALVPQPW